MNCVNCKNQINQTNQSSDNCQPVLEGNSRPNHPQSARESSRRPRPHQPVFPKNPAGAPTMRYTGPYNRHSRPRPRRNSTLCDQRRQSAHPTNVPQPCRAHRRTPCPALPHPYTVRISQRTVFLYVSDRLRSSGIVRARRCPPPGIPAEMPRYSPDSARQTGKKSASKRVISRRYAAKYTRKRPEKKVSSRLIGDIDISNCWSTNVAIYSIPAFNSDFVPPNSWREDRRAGRSLQLFPSQESDELSSDKCQRALEIKH